MPRGYAEGPAAEEAEQRREELARGVAKLFGSGKAWGLTVARQRRA